MEFRRSIRVFNDMVSQLCCVHVCDDKIIVVVLSVSVCVLSVACMSSKHGISSIGTCFQRHGVSTVLFACLRRQDHRSRFVCFCLRFFCLWHTCLQKHEISSIDTCFQRHGVSTVLCSCLERQDRRSRFVCFCLRFVCGMHVFKYMEFGQSIRVFNDMVCLYVCACWFVWSYVCMSVCMCVCVCVCLCVRLCMWSPLCVCLGVSVCVRVCERIFNYNFCFISLCERVRYVCLCMSVFGLWHVFKDVLCRTSSIDLWHVLKDMVGRRAVHVFNDMVRHSTRKLCLRVCGCLARLVEGFPLAWHTRKPTLSHKWIHKHCHTAQTLCYFKRSTNIENMVK